jgi:hypothetical protein
MKKIFFVVLCFVFPLIVYAKDDILTIEKLDTYIMPADNGYCSYDETVSAKLTLGDNPSTYYYVKKIPKTGTYKYFTDRVIDYNVSISSINVPDKYYGVDSENKKNYIISVGTDAALLDETNTITISYVSNYISNRLSNNEYFFDIAKSDYDIKKVNFEIELASKPDRMLFSNNGKDYFETLDGLNYDINDTYNVVGTYSKALTKGNSLSVKIIFDLKYSSSLDFKQMVVYGSFGVFLLFLAVIIYRIFNHKKKK